MKKTILLLALLLLCGINTRAQKKYSAYAVGFYNMENLFDTCHDEGKNDYEYLPNGSNRWDALKYTNKLKNMSQARRDWTERGGEQQGARRPHGTGTAEGTWL